MCSDMACLIGSDYRGEPQPECRAFVPGVVDRDSSVMFRDNLMDDAEAEPVPFPGSFVVKNGSKIFGQDRRRNAWAGIGNGHVDRSASCATASVKRRFLPSPGPRC